MYIINNVKELKFEQARKRLYEIDEIAYIDNIYYVKSNNEFYSLDKKVLKVLMLTDRTRLCAKALRELKDNQLINKDLVIENIDKFKIIKAKDINLTLEDIENKRIDIDISMFDDYTFAEMYKYILSADTKYMYLYEIASKKFDEEYNTEDKQRVFFSKLSLNAHSNFADMYINNNKLHKVQEEIWLKKSVEEASSVINNLDKALYNTKNKEFSNVYIKELLSKKKITEEEYKIVTKMNTILHILLQANLKHITFKSFEELSLIDEFINSFSEFKDMKINRVIRLESDMIVKLINNYIYLQDKLIELE